MEKSTRNTILLFLAMCLTIALTLPYCKKEVESTTLEVINTTEDTVSGWLTLGNLGDSNYVNSTQGIFGITADSFKGRFIVLPKETLSYRSHLAFNGNIAFGAQPQNCPDSNVWPYGINLFEFELNNSFQIDGDETVDISAVSGVNSILHVNLTTSKYNQWSDGEKNINFFKNDSLYKNTGLSGVYPFGCDSCVGITKKTPYCEGHKSYAVPQSDNICNIQRSSQSKGGKVSVSFMGFIK